MPDNTDPFGSITIKKNTKPGAGKPLAKIRLHETIGGQRKKPLQRIRKPEKTRKFLWLLPLPFFFALLYMAVGYFLLPSLCQNILSSTLEKHLKRHVTVAGASFNPLTSTLTLNNTIIGPRLDQPEDPVDPVLAFRELRANINLFPLLQGKIFCSTLHIDQLFVHLVHHHDGTYNFANLLLASEKKGAASLNVPFGAYNIEISDSRLIFTDLPSNKTHILEKVSLTLPALTGLGKGSFDSRSVQSGQLIEPRFSAIINNSPVNLNGETRIGTDFIQARLHLFLNDIELAKYLAYLPGTKIKIRKGVADFDLNLVFNQPAGDALEVLIQGNGQISSLWLQNESGQSSQFPQIRLSGAISPRQKRFRFDEIYFLTPEIYLQRSTDGSLIFPGHKLITNLFDQKNDLKINHLTVDKGKISFFDKSLAPPLHLEITALHFQAGNLSSTKNSMGTIDGHLLCGDGKITLRGSMGLVPLKTALEISIEDSDLTFFKPLLSQWLRPTLTNGLISAGGRMKWPDFSYTGALGIKNIQTQNAEQQKNLACSTAHTETFELRLEPLEIKMGLIEIDKGFLDWTVSKKNKSWPETCFQPSFLDKEKSISIDGLSLANGCFSYRDMRLSPIFASELTLSGKTGRISNQPGNQTEFTFHGANSDQAQFSISGEFDFFKGNTAFQAKILQQPLTPFLPYLKNSLGHDLKSGIFDLTTSYRMTDNTITAANKLTISDLKLEASRSPSCLPLTVALLQDQNRHIEYKIDISANSSYPAYSFQGHLGRGLRNLVLKTAVAPFSLLSELESGQPADHLLFHSGTSMLTNEAKPQLRRLADILKKRPGLQISIMGFASEDKDKKALLVTLKKKNELQQMIRDSQSPAAKSTSVITKAHLLDLACQRAATVFAYLISDLHANPLQLICDQKGSVVPAHTPGKRGSRVDFLLGASDDFVSVHQEHGFR